MVAGMNLEQLKKDIGYRVSWSHQPIILTLLEKRYPSRGEVGTVWNRRVPAGHGRILVRQELPQSGRDDGRSFTVPQAAPANRSPLYDCTGSRNT
jgi:hypothetical protein